MFNHFVSLGISPTFLDPDRTTIDRYVGIQDESIIVSKVISQSPKRQKGSLQSYAKLEKILVDILVDENKYYVYQGQELSTIFENAFDTFIINQDSMLRYAGRRTAQDKLKRFILNKTNLKLRVYSENPCDYTSNPHTNGLKTSRLNTTLSLDVIMAFILVEIYNRADYLSYLKGEHPYP